MKNLPEIIIHNSISIDGSLTGFMPDMETHYRIAGGFTPDIHLIGSETIIKGIEMFGGEVPPEEPRDFNKPLRSNDLPIWAVIDSGGRLMGLHHTSRRFEFCRDIVVLVSHSTPGEYLKHLEERNYDVIITGDDKVGLIDALQALKERYNARTILTDTGMILGNLLINLKLVSKISMLVHPVIIGRNSYNMFRNIECELDLVVARKEEMGNNLVWLVYDVEYSRKRRSQ